MHSSKPALVFARASMILSPSFGEIISTAVIALPIPQWKAIPA
jgi:hypothetical protein